jgi:hypothetical protein
MIGDCYLGFGFWDLDFEIEAAPGPETGWSQTECQE